LHDQTLRGFLCNFVPIPIFFHIFAMKFLWAAWFQGVPSIAKMVPGRIHSLFSGTSLIQTTAPERAKKTNNLADPKSPPDDGLLAEVGPSGRSNGPWPKDSVLMLKDITRFTRNKGSAGKN
jgi:hypothetical protein